MLDDYYFFVIMLLSNNKCNIYADNKKYSIANYVFKIQYVHNMCIYCKNSSYLYLFQLVKYILFFRMRIIYINNTHSYLFYSKKKPLLFSIKIRYYSIKIKSNINKDDNVEKKITFFYDDIKESETLNDSDYSYLLWYNHNNYYTQRIVRSYYDFLWRDTSSLLIYDGDDVLWGTEGIRWVKDANYKPFSYNCVSFNPTIKTKKHFLDTFTMPSDIAENTSMLYKKAVLQRMDLFNVDSSRPRVFFPTDRYGALDTWITQFSKNETFINNSCLDPFFSFDPEFVYLRSVNNNYNDNVNSNIIRELTTPYFVPSEIRYRNVEGFYSDSFDVERPYVNDSKDYLYNVLRKKKYKSDLYSEMDSFFEKINIWDRLGSVVSKDRFFDFFHDKLNINNIPDVYDYSCTSGTEYYILFVESLRIKFRLFFSFFFDNTFFSVLFFVIIFLFVLFVLYIVPFFFFGKPSIVVSDFDNNYRTWWFFFFFFFFDLFISWFYIFLTIVTSQNLYINQIFNYNMLSTALFFFFFHFFFFLLLSLFAKFFFLKFFKPIYLKKVSVFFFDYLGLRGTFKLINPNNNKFDFFWISAFSFIFHFFFFFTFAFALYYLYLYYLFYYCAYGPTYSYHLFKRFLWVCYSFLPQDIIIRIHFELSRVVCYGQFFRFYIKKFKTLPPFIPSFNLKEKFKLPNFYKYNTYSLVGGKNRKRAFFSDTEFNWTSYIKYYTVFHRQYTVALNGNSNNIVRRSKDENSFLFNSVVRINYDSYNTIVNTDNIDFNKFISEILPSLNKRSVRSTYLFSDRYLSSRFKKLNEFPLNKFNFFIRNYNNYNTSIIFSYINTCYSLINNMFKFNIYSPLSSYYRIFYSDEFSNSHFDDWRYNSHWYFVQKFFHRHSYRRIFNALHDLNTGFYQSRGLSSWFFRRSNGFFYFPDLFFSNKCAEYNLLYNHLFSKDILLFKRYRLLNRYYKEYAYWNNVFFFSVFNNNIFSERQNIVKKMLHSRDLHFFSLSNYKDKMKLDNVVDMIDNLEWILEPRRIKRYRYHPFFNNYSYLSINSYIKNWLKEFSVNDYSKNVNVNYIIDEHKYPFLLDLNLFDCSNFDKENTLSYLLSVNRIKRNSIYRRSNIIRQIFYLINKNDYCSLLKYSNGYKYSKLNRVLCKRQFLSDFVSTYLHFYKFGRDSFDLYRFPVLYGNSIRDLLSFNTDLNLFLNNKFYINSEAPFVSCFKFFRINPISYETKISNNSLLKSDYLECVSDFNVSNESFDNLFFWSSKICSQYNFAETPSFFIISPYNCSNNYFVSYNFLSSVIYRLSMYNENDDTNGFLVVSNSFGCRSNSSVNIE